jgi:hypothetical protein
MDYSQNLLEELMSGSHLLGDSEPQYIISGSGWGWYLDPEIHQMVRVAKGQEIIPMPGNSDDHDRLLVRASFRFLMIPEEEVQEIGWN